MKEFAMNGTPVKMWANYGMATDFEPLQPALCF